MVHPPQTLQVLFDLCISNTSIDMRNLTPSSTTNESALSDALGYLADKQLIVIDYADNHAWAVPTDAGAELLTMVFLKPTQLL